MSNSRTYGTIHSEQKPFVIQHANSTDYLLGGSLVMTNGKIDKNQFEEGYCQATPMYENNDHNKMPIAESFTFCYYDKDHLGNIRQVTQDYNGISNGKVIQTMNYYPFGAEFCDNSTKSYVQNHKYNGKEFDNMHGLNTYDYGARQYNPVTGRWDRMDPHSEDYKDVSPFAYCHNNPVMRIDPDGQDDYRLDQNGELSRWRITKDKNDCIYSENGKNSITVNKSITTQLALNHKNYNGHYAIGSSQEEMTNLFSFVANNTNVEWKLTGYNTKNGDRFLLNTEHSSNEVGSPDVSGLNLSDIFIRVHNHPGPGNEQPSGFRENKDYTRLPDGSYYFPAGMSSDKLTAWNISDVCKKAGHKAPSFYMYHPKTQTLVKYDYRNIGKRTKVKNGKLCFF